MSPGASRSFDWGRRDDYASGMSCPACGQAAAPEARFCVACGGPLGLRCPRCAAVPPPAAQFCPACGARLVPEAGQPATAPSSGPSTPTTAERSIPTTDDPLEDFELEEAIERIRRGEQRRRERRGGLAITVVVAALAVLVGATWLVVSGRHAAGPLRAAEPTPGAADAPATSEPEVRRDGDLVAVPESATREAGDVSATVAEVERQAPPAAAEIERKPLPPSPREEVASPPAPRPELPRPPAPRQDVASPAAPRQEPPRAPAPRQDVASPPARARSGAPDVKPPQPERPPPESPSSPSFRARADWDREMVVEIATERLADGLTRYTVRLRERDGRPVTNATVSIHGRRADGAPVDTTLDRAAEPGSYRAVGRFTGGITDGRLRVVSVDRVQDMPLPDALR